MSKARTDLDLEDLEDLETGLDPESDLEGDLEGDLETDALLEDESLPGEGEDEGEPFFGKLRGIAKLAGRAALMGMGPAGMAAAALLDSRGKKRRRQRELEFEDLELEALDPESEVDPTLRASPARAMEHLAHMAAEAESPGDSEAFLGALVPLAAQLVARRVLPTVMRAAPQLVRGVTQVAKTLRATPQGRSLMRTVPTIVRRSVARVARSVAQGAPVSPGGAVRILASETSRVLSSPRRCRCAIRRSRALDRGYHREAEDLG
ncbi:MAG: hypothetical protein IT458_06770 [Planctomycetes bacterium]|nr:hypothetical protein [Planctomycetota bacterium]